MSMSVSTPNFGGCLNSITGKLDFCAFSPANCKGGESIYVKPDEISQNRCGALQVEVGRCESAIDDNLCTLSNSACQITSKHNKDGTCNLINDISGAMTRYPYCRVLPAFDENQPFRCVVSKDDCTDKELFIELTTFSRQDPCYCDHVPTGICYLSAISEITTDSSFCAVNEYDCPENYDWMSAQEMLNMNPPPRYCRLCHHSMSNIQLHENVVQSGGCFQNSTFLRCALQSTDCLDNEIFKSSPEMYELGVMPCPSDEIKGGECTSSMEDISCTNIAESCLLPQKFAYDDSCTIHSDSRSGIPAWFGHCQTNEKIKNSNWDDYRCVWKQSECDVTNELWYPASGQMDWFEGCNCEDVLTGACQYEGKYHCAVSDMGCADPSTYLKSNQLEDIGMICHLCNPKPRTIITNDLSDTKEDNSISDKQNDIVLEDPNEPSSKPSIDANTGAIIAGAVGGVFVLTSLAIFVYIRKTKK